ncbi:MAG: hypothetical protein GXP62_07325, partial [Oligoflexia bacterium]|nr:hypothetical protein [Oligoflexia bacterium]
HVQVRVPETREISTKQVVLLLDSYLPTGRILDDAIGMGRVLDHLVETWLSLAAELVQRGDQVTLVACVDDGDGELRVESVPGRASRRRWQDLGARVRWQGVADLPNLLQALDGAQDTHGVAVSSRFFAPPPQSLGGESFTWVYLPPVQALGELEPSFWRVCLRSTDTGRTLLGRFFRLPGPVGSDENRSFAQLQGIWREYVAYQARRRLRLIARRRGDATLAALMSRDETVYRLEPGVAGGHRLVGLVAGGLGEARGGPAS